MKKNCDMCMMPFSQDKGNRENENYCSYCFKGGSLVYKGDSLQEFKKQSYEGMINNGVPKYQAKFFTWMIGFAPHWKDKK
ncbi:hypothetical protein KC865_02105 [Candidatus Kaiserbacteria bacterium]|nr:hypothetical protein [Candidatus Kaiserbacteria bacterium]USN92185.1 MAG: hypothetical protein H6782_04910 [Candidatus Nomurabacteria bacterium]